MITGPSPVRSRHAHMWMPIVASHFPPEYPFVQQRVPTHSPAHLPLSAAGIRNHTPLITEQGTLLIPPAPAAPVALVPVRILHFHISVAIAN